MARDRDELTDDDFDDRPRRGRRDDDTPDDRDDFDDRPRRRPGVAEARSKVAAPAILLIVFGVLSTLLSLWPAFQVVAMHDDVVAQFKENNAQAQKLPAGPQRDQQVAINKWLETNVTPLFLGVSVAGLVPSLLILLGGVKMKSLSGYGLAVTGSILATVPFCNGCACLSTPFGIWALVVLLNSDVKAAFGRSA